MSALLALVLAAADLPPPPLVEAPQSPPPTEVAPAKDDLGAQLTFGTVSTVNGLWVGLNASAALGIYAGSPGFLLGGLLGAGAGAGVAYYTRHLGGEWGRAVLLDSGMVGAAVAGLWLATRPFWPSSELRYLAAMGIDVAGTAGVMALALHVAPRPEAVWLADSLVVWGAIVSSLMLGVVPAPGNDPTNVVFGGAAAGGLAGALLAGSAGHVSSTRFWVANVGALVGGLLLGGGLWLVEQVLTGPGHPFQPVVPSVGAAAGVAGGFLVGFAFSEKL